jgi:hypothetical protein
MGIVLPTITAFDSSDVLTGYARQLRHFWRSQAEAEKLPHIGDLLVGVFLATLARLFLSPVKAISVNCIPQVLFLSAFVKMVGVYTARVVAGVVRLMVRFELPTQFQDQSHAVSLDGLTVDPHASVTVSRSIPIPHYAIAHARRFLTVCFGGQAWAL